MHEIKWENIKDEDEKNFLKQVLSYRSKAEKYQCNFYTDFYSYEWMNDILTHYIGNDHLFSPVFYGGYLNAERQILGFEPWEHDENVLKIIHIIVKTGIGKKLTHRDFLGALLGLGIERCKIGDIVLQDTGAYVVVKSEIADYIMTHLTQIGRYKQIILNEMKDPLQITPPVTKKISATIASLRADNFFAAGFQVSRTIAKNLLMQEKGRCNGKIIKPDTLLQVGDVCTLKGYGKMQIVAIGGLTKKNRICVTIEKYI